MENKWTKFNYDDGAEVFYQIDKAEETVTFMKNIDGLESETVTVYFDELEEVYNKIKEIK